MIENKNAVGKPADDFIRIQDLGSMFVPRWRWFALSLAVALSAAALYLLRTPAIYTRHAAILVKDDSKGGATSGSMGEFADFGLFKSNTNINNELLTLASPTLMTEVVKRLGLDETYTVRRGLRRVELYRSAPVAVRFCGKAERPVAFDLELTSRNDFLLSGFKVEGEETGETFSGKTGDTLRTSVGTLLIDATPYATDDFMGTSIHYGKQSVQAVTDYYTGALRAELGNEDATIINLSIDDSSVRKAEDILNTLIEVYNEYWIRDKNQIAVSTSQFIGDRLGVIENELGHVDANIAGYKSEHLLPDVQAASSLYLMQSAENKKELLALNNQLSTARYIRGELNGKGLTQLLPANSDIGNSHIESLIGEYNAQVLERNRLAANSSEKNPLVVDLTASLRNLHHTVVQSVDNLIVSLDTQLQSVRRREAATTGQLASNPDQARYLLSVERQQKVKEQLYLYLLQKREENELSQAFTAYNTRIITAPRGSLLPTAPPQVQHPAGGVRRRPAASGGAYLHEGEHEHQGARAQGFGRGDRAVHRRDTAFCPQAKEMVRESARNEHDCREGGQPGHHQRGVPCAAHQPGVHDGQGRPVQRHCLHLVQSGKRQVLPGYEHIRQPCHQGKEGAGGGR